MTFDAETGVNPNNLAASAAPTDQTGARALNTTYANGSRTRIVVVSWTANVAAGTVAYLCARSSTGAPVTAGSGGDLAGTAPVAEVRAADSKYNAGIGSANFQFGLVAIIPPNHNYRLNTGAMSGIVLSSWQEMDW